MWKTYFFLAGGNCNVSLTLIIILKVEELLCLLDKYPSMQHKIVNENKKLDYCTKIVDSIRHSAHLALTRVTAQHAS